jgi:hypothetical protein
MAIFRHAILTLIFFFFSNLQSFAHGGAVQMQKAAGPFQVTVFSMPGVLCAGPADLSVLVQRDRQSEPVLDAEVTVGLIPIDSVQKGGGAWQPPYCAMDLSQNLSSMHAPRTGLGGNQLLYDTLAKIPSPGKWLLRVTVKEGSDTGTAEAPLDIAPPPAPWTTYWPLFLFPALVITGFCIKQVRT